MSIHHFLLQEPLSCRKKSPIRRANLAKLSLDSVFRCGYEESKSRIFALIVAEARLGLGGDVQRYSGVLVCDPIVNKDTNKSSAVLYPGVCVVMKAF